MKSYNYGKPLDPIKWDYTYPMIPVGEAIELPNPKGMELWCLLNYIWRKE